MNSGIIDMQSVGRLQGVKTTNFSNYWQVFSLGKKKKKKVLLHGSRHKTNYLGSVFPSSGQTCRAGIGKFLLCFFPTFSSHGGVFPLACLQRTEFCLFMGKFASKIFNFKKNLMGLASYIESLQKHIPWPPAWGLLARPQLASLAQKRVCRKSDYGVTLLMPGE